MPPRSSPSITSTTKRAKCLSGSHSSTDGGRRNAVRRSKSRKLLIAIKPPFGANQWRDSSENQRRWVKSDRLLDPRAGQRKSRLGSATGLADDQNEYVLDDSARSTLPPGARTPRPGDRHPAARGAFSKQNAYSGKPGHANRRLISGAIRRQKRSSRADRG